MSTPRLLVTILAVIAIVAGVIAGGTLLLMKVDGYWPRERFKQECRDDGLFLQYSSTIDCVAGDGTIIRQYDS